jgi:D-alanyl-D-alanine carboxypeptidase (penicillin-binding protein 5/6)
MIITKPRRSAHTLTGSTRRRIRSRAFALSAAVACLVVSTAAIGLPVAGASVPVIAAAPNGDPYVPPSETVETPSTDDCAQRTQPPPAVDTSEDVPPGATAPAPLPVPANPVGGGRLGECGLIVPAGAPPLPSDISTGAWLIADLDTGEVLAAKDPHGRYRPASTLKLLTVQPLLKNLKNLDLIVEGTENDAGQDGTRVGIEAGGKYTVKQLLTYLIIISGNDAANALARTNGGYDKTVADMNATAQALGALDTRAATVSGLDGPGQSTSAYDLALFAKADMATPLFPEIVSSVDVRVPAAEGEGYIAANDNQLLYQYPGALGGKTGFTDDAGNTYVGMAGRDGRRLVVTMMHGTQQPRRQWMQGASLLDWGFALPANTPPVGTLVKSLAEATAVAAAPTPSTTAPISAASTGSASATSSGSGASTSEGAPETTSSSTSSGTPTALILAGIGLLIVIAGIGLLLRRRHLNKRPVFAGDAKPAEADAETAAETPAEVATEAEPEPAAEADPLADSTTADPAEPAPAAPAPDATALAEPAPDATVPDATVPAESDPSVETEPEAPTTDPKS